jgi:hypothetical protein
VSETLQIDWPPANAANGIVDQEAGGIVTGTIVGWMSEYLDVVKVIDGIFQTDMDRIGVEGA